MYLALIVASLLYCAPLFNGINNYGRNDWDQFSFRYETPRLALLRDHQLPFWNPYVNGGTVLLAHPDSPFPSPWYLLVLLLGAPLGLRVQAVVFMVLGATGMAALLRRWRVPAPGCFVGGVVFIMSSHFVMHIAEGHLEWCVLGLMPWLMLCLLSIETDAKFIIITAFLLASVMTFGSVYIIAVYIPFLSVWALLYSIRRGTWRPVLSWVCIFILTLLLSAVKLLPQISFVTDNPRQVEADGFSPIGFFDMFLNPHQVILNQVTHYMEENGRLGVSTPGNSEMPKRKYYPLLKALSESEVMSIYKRLQGIGLAEYKWHEYGGYITYIGLALAFAGLVIFWRIHWPLYSAGFLVAIIMLGNGSCIDLWAMLKRLPLYGQLHVSTRFLSALVLVLAFAAGRGLGWLCQWIDATDRRFLKIFITRVIPVAVYLELVVIGWSLFGDVFIGRPVQLPQFEQFALRYKTIGSENPRLRNYLYPLLESNSGVLEGYENLQLKRGDVRSIDGPLYRGEVYFENSSEPVVIQKWTMSRVKVAFETQKHDILRLNQNYSKGWRGIIYAPGSSRDVAAQHDATGLVSVSVNPVDVGVEFYYTPPNFTKGLLISTITLILCILLLCILSLYQKKHLLKGG